MIQGVKWFLTPLYSRRAIAALRLLADLHVFALKGGSNRSVVLRPAENIKAEPVHIQVSLLSGRSWDFLT
jgi:hypothetical protein